MDKDTYRLISSRSREFRREVFDAMDCAINRAQSNHLDLVERCVLRERRLLAGFAAAAVLFGTTAAYTIFECKKAERIAARAIAGNATITADAENWYEVVNTEGCTFEIWKLGKWPQDKPPRPEVTFTLPGECSPK
jgi:hypothetical protein